MAWIDIPYTHITFGVFVGSTAGATVHVAAADLLMCRYKALGPDTLALDVRVGKAFFKPATAAITGITMELAIPPYNSVFFPPLGAPNPFMDAGQTYSNDCIIAIDPGSISHVPGCIAVLNEASHKIVLLIRNVSGTNLNASTVGVVGFFGQITFEVISKG
jgi:hypothetical protein